jgi:hypothetical protein
LLSATISASMSTTETGNSEGVAQPWSRLQALRQSVRDVPPAQVRAWATPGIISLGFGLLCTIVSWPVISLAPVTGLDSSWRSGLAMAAVHHIEWGSRLDFTYGPLGFLTVRALYFGSTAALAFLYQFVVELALFSLLFRFTRKSFPPLLAAVVSYAIGATAVELVDAGDLLMGPTFLLAILAVREQRQWNRRLLLALLGTIGAVGILIKFGDGLVVIGFAVIIVAVGRGKARIAESAAAGLSFVVVLLVSWLATGNRLGSLPEYLRYSVSIAGGYASAMQVEMGRTDEWWYAGIILLILAALTILVVRTRGRREQVGTALLVAAYAWWGLKEGFVRHDAHDLIFFSSMLVALAIFGFSSSGLRPFFIAMVAFVSVITWTAAGVVPSNLLSLATDAHGFGRQIHTIVGHQVRNATIDAARVQMQSTYALSPAMISELDHQTVAIEPWENSVAWAYPTIRWDPEPVLQAYTAYSASLDALDSHFLKSSAAPSRILEQPPQAIDGRDPSFEPPTTFVTVLCHYVQLNASPTWQVLTRVSNRCGPSHLLARVTATFGQSVPVPAGSPGTMVVARFQAISLPIGYKISAAVLKPPITYMNVPGAQFRFLTGTAGDLHLLRTPSSVGYSAPFMPPTVSSFTLSGAGVAPMSGHYVVSFYSMRVAAR